MSKLLLDWVIVATSGATADGRTLNAEQLEQMASSYQPSEYTAIVNIEHFGGNFGTVHALRINKDSKARTILEAQIQPNADYLALNQQKRKQFFSIEFVSDFAKTGNAYLVGLAITDTPASLGTTKCEFTSQTPIERFSTGSEFEFDFQTQPNNMILSFFKNLFTQNQSQNEVKKMPTNTPATPEATTHAFTAEEVKSIAQEAVKEALSAHAKEAEKNQKQATTDATIESLTAENKTLKEELAKLKEAAPSTQLSANTGITEPAEELY